MDSDVEKKILFAVNNRVRKIRAFAISRRRLRASIVTVQRGMKLALARRRRWLSDA